MSDCNCDTTGDGNPELHLKCVTERMEVAEEKLEKIARWCDAYPLDMFPEPDLKKAEAALQERGMSIGGISASAMRHVLKGVKRIIEE